MIFPILKIGNATKQQKVPPLRKQTNKQNPIISSEKMLIKYVYAAFRRKCPGRANVAKRVLLSRQIK